VCKVIGTRSGGVEAVHCADLIEENGLLNGVPASDFIAQNEVYCQNAYTAALVDCKSVVESVEIVGKNPSTGAVHVRLRSGECGASIGHSDCGARRILNIDSDAILTMPGHGSCQAWAETGDTAFGGRADTVTLPDGAVESSGNLGTPHVTGACSK
jgi:hypothetical protein